MARVKICGVCWKPVAECICTEDEDLDDTAVEACGE